MLSHYELARLGVDVCTPRGLAHLLRHREYWPRGFEWEYRNCYYCAMALLFRALDVQMPAESDPTRSVDEVVRAAAGILDLDFAIARNIFVELYFAGQETSPEQVADALEQCAPRRLRHVRRHARRVAA